MQNKLNLTNGSIFIENGMNYLFGVLGLGSILGIIFPKNLGMAGVFLNSMLFSKKHRFLAKANEIHIFFITSNASRSKWTSLVDFYQIKNGTAFRETTKDQ